MVDTRITIGNVEVAPGCAISFDKSVSYFAVQVGKYSVSVVDGVLTVRATGSNHELLKVPANG